MKYDGAAWAYKKESEMYINLAEKYKAATAEYERAVEAYNNATGGAQVALHATLRA